MAVVGAVAIVAALSLLTVSAISLLDSDDGGRQTVGLGPELPGDDEPDRTTTTRRRSTTSTTTTSTSAPEVLGEVTTRDPGATTSTTAAAPAGGGPRPATRPTATPVAPGPGPTTTAPPSTAPPTTVCRNSTDPSCGPFRWDPEPTGYDVEVRVVTVPLRVTVGEEVTFAVDVVERAGPDALGACAGWTVRHPDIVNTSTCEVANHSCARTGPHDQPAPSEHLVPVTRTVTFPTAGEFEVEVSGHTATHLADGCASPWFDGFIRTYQVEVVEPG